MTNKVIYTLLGASLILSTAVGCKKSSDAPSELNVANVTASLSGNSAPRALFVGQDKPGAPEDSPKKIDWGGKGKELPMLIYQPTGTETRARVSSMILKDDYQGDLRVPYEDSNVASDGSIKYFATNGVVTTNDAPTKGAIISAKSNYKNSKATLYTAPANGGNVDMANPGVDWPLISVSDANNPTQMWSTVNKSGGGRVHFDLFGNVFLVMFDNISEENGYDANSKDAATNLRPELTIESNGMAFAGSIFTNDVFATTINPWEVNPINKITYRVSNLDFSDKSKRQILPIWFRPMTPVNENETFSIKITWKVYNPKQPRWEESVYKFRKPKGKDFEANGTMFAHDDGRYYRMSVGISPVASAEFGSNSFYIVPIKNIPAFD